MADETDAPIELYADSLKLDVHVYGAVLKFGLLRGPDVGEQTVAIVRISPQMLHIMSRLLVNASNKYDKDVGKVVLPDTLYAELGLKKDME